MRIVEDAPRLPPRPAPAVTILVGDAMEKLRGRPDGSVHCVVTSVPYWGLRDYSRCSCVLRDHPGDDGTSWNRMGQSTPEKRHHANASCQHCGGSGFIEVVSLNQIGLERSIHEWVARLVCVFEEVRRVLRPDGTLWLNVGDSHAGNGGARTDHDGQLPPGHEAYAKWNREWGDLKPKDLVGQPWRLAFALQAAGWILRKDIIWAKRNVMPESVIDRPTSAHEYIFLLAKSQRYFYDAEAVKEDAAPDETARRRREAQQNLNSSYALKRDAPHGQTPPGRAGSARSARARQLLALEGRRNCRTVWEVSSSPYPEAHFATFPEIIPQRCISAGTSDIGACAECEAPWQRVTTKEWLNPRPIKKAKQQDWSVAKGTGGKAFKKGGINEGTFPTGVIVRTQGWRPTCECNGRLVKRVVKKIAHADWAEPGYADAAGLPNVQRKARNIEAREVERTETFYESDLPLEQHPVVPCVVLDPFAGSGTTGAVARRMGRSSVLIELNPQYVDMIKARTQADQRSLAEVSA